jgi:hypothetical protein
MMRDSDRLERCALRRRRRDVPYRGDELPDIGRMAEHGQMQVKRYSIQQIFTSNSVLSYQQ